MSKKIALKKLGLGKDTMRVLGEQALGQAGGGAIPLTGTSCYSLCHTRVRTCGEP